MNSTRHDGDTWDLASSVGATADALRMGDLLYVSGVLDTYGVSDRYTPQ